MANTKILLVDDDANYLLAVKNSLMDAGVEVVSISNPVERDRIYKKQSNRYCTGRLLHARNDRRRICKKIKRI